MDKNTYQQAQPRHPARLSCPPSLRLCARIATLLTLWALTRNAPILAGYIPSPSACNYTETTGKDSRNFLWTLEKDDGWLLVSEDKLETHRAWLDTSLNTYKWSLDRPANDTTMTATKQGDTLHLQGTLNGKSHQRDYQLGRTPWYQALSLSLRKHLGEAFVKEEFWSIRPDTLELHKMQIIKISEERLKIEGTIQPTYRVIVRPAGWKAPLWKGEYWFSRNDGKFIRYRGDSGPPGSPDTIVELSKNKP